MAFFAPASFPESCRRRLDAPTCSEPCDREIQSGRPCPVVNTHARLCWGNLSDKSRRVQVFQPFLRVVIHWRRALSENKMKGSAFANAGKLGIGRCCYKGRDFVQEERTAVVLYRSWARRPTDDFAAGASLFVTQRKSFNPSFLALCLF